MFILSSLKLNVVISLGEYINAVVSRTVIGLDPPLSATVSISKPPPPSAADVICERSLSVHLDPPNL